MKLTGTKLIRMQRGMTQAVASDKLNISKVYLSQVENEKVRPSEDLLYRMCKVYGCMKHELLH